MAITGTTSGSYATFTASADADNPEGKAGAFKFHARHIDDSDSIFNRAWASLLAWFESSDLGSVARFSAIWGIVAYSAILCQTGVTKLGPFVVPMFG